jgi:hypothetical protein
MSQTARLSLKKASYVLAGQTLLQLKIQPLNKGGIDCAEHNSSTSSGTAETVISEIGYSILQEDCA